MRTCRRCTCRARATPTSRACRSTATATCATCSSAPARARPRRASPAAPPRDDLTVGDFDAVDESPVRCLDADATAAMVDEIDRGRKANESLGGVFEVRAFGLVPGLGSHISWEERLDGRLAQAILSIHSMKGTEVGGGYALAGIPGSQAHDEICWSAERGYYRETNRAG